MDQRNIYLLCALNQERRLKMDALEAVVLTIFVINFIKQLVLLIKEEKSSNFSAVAGWFCAILGQINFMYK